jgi:Fe-S-cluster containining protein
MVENKEINPFDCRKCASCCKKGQTIELTIAEAGRLGKNTKLQIDVMQTLEYRTLLWGGVVCELLEDCGNLTDLSDGRFACGVYNTSEIPGACRGSQPGWDFCLEARSQNNL